MYTLFRKLQYKPLLEDKKGAKARPSVRAQLHAFKLGVRKVVRENVQDEDSKKFLKAGGKKGYALKRLGVLSHMPHVGSCVRMPEDVQREIDRDIVILNGTPIKKIGKQLKEGVDVKEGKLLLQNKSAWISRITRLENKLAEAFPLKAPPEQTRGSEVPSKRGGADKGSGQVSRSRLKARTLAPPVHDFVQPLVRHSQKRPFIEETVLRTGMLSKRLRERFGHLCKA